MAYSVKWVEQHLGITRNMLRYYEKEALLPKNKDRKYRDYSDEDIERIWVIKLFIGIGFSTKEIYSFMNDPAFDFYTAISTKIEELEKKHDMDLNFLEYAKTIKFIGGMPTTSKIGSVRFDDFLQYAHENWNIYKDPTSACIMQSYETFSSKPLTEMSMEEAERVLNLFEDKANLILGMAIQVFYQIISDMKDLEYSSETVQRVVDSLCKYYVEHNMNPNSKGKFTPQYYAKALAPALICGDLSEYYESLYGEEGCLYIVKALAYYGKYDIEDLFLKYV